MGSALLKGWISKGVPTSSIYVLDPHPSSWLNSISVKLNHELPSTPPAVCVIAVKPQILPKSIGQVASLGGGKTLFVSVAAGVRMQYFVDVMGARTPIIRAMPNTPAAIGRGISALIGNDKVEDSQLALAESLLSAVGETVLIEQESAMDAVTAISGSGPAYVFYMIEALTQAGIEQGLSAEVALQLAKSTVAGSGKLAIESGQSPAQLRIDVTSPAGTTEAALKVLMNSKSGLLKLMKNTVNAATRRSQELGNSSE